MATRPFDLIHQSLKKQVLVAMKNGNSFSGTMMSYDENLNLYLTGAKSIENDTEYKHLVLKGGNIISVIPG